MKLLLHQCCGPCSIYPLDRLLSDGVNVHGYFFNPNIHPFTEYRQRRDTLVEHNNNIGISYTIIEDYGLRAFIDMSLTADSRCGGCYRMRLENTAKFALDNKFDMFSTTLLYSRYQNHEQIKLIASEISEKYNIGFFYEDYRAGWQIGIDKSKQLDMYRQKYCGCIFSEEERYCKNQLNSIQ